MPADIEPPLISLSERIAALKLAQNGELAIGVPRQNRPPKSIRPSQNVANVDDNQAEDSPKIAPRKPALPSRPSFLADDKPALPSRASRPSSVATVDQRPAYPSRRPSTPTSTVSIISTDEQEKPSLPPRRPSTSSMSSMNDKTKPNRALPPPPAPSSTPIMPSRPQKLQQETMPELLPPRTQQLRQETAPALSAKPPPTPRRPASLAEPTGRPPRLPTRPVSATLDEDIPPPIPRATRPTARKKVEKPVDVVCLKCRDFSEVDSHAALYPREEYIDAPIDWIALQLTEPFPSWTDKARAIFTWLHQNVEYDVYSFYNNCVKSQTPEQTLASGLAVCEGYAGLFQAMATASGLESVKITGHGKGVGFTSLTETIPPYNGNHAWNAVRIDKGEWKLIDTCWGAGAVQGPNQPYKKVFCPVWFTFDNAEFGLKHYPENRKHWYVTDIPTWDEYFIGEGGEAVRIAGSMINDHGLSELSVLPRYKAIDLSTDETHIRFQFSNVCEHWYGKYGEQRVYILAINGVNGKSDWLPLQKHEYTWWIDVPIKQLGNPGQQVSLNVIDSIDGKKVHNLTVQEYLAAKGRKGMSWQGFAHWDLV